MSIVLLLLIYFCFIAFGIPDAFLGAAWPAMYEDLGVSLSTMGVITIIFASGKAFASAINEKLTRVFGPGKLILITTLITAASLFGFAASRSFLMFCVWAVPYGLASGSVSTSINKYVALHYENRHMNWLHCMWGIGSTLGPYVISFALSRGHWSTGYLYGGVLLIVLAVLLLISLPKWKNSVSDSTGAAAKPLGIREMLRLPGAKGMMVTFFCYCALEQATALWSTTYLTLRYEVDAAAAAGYASLFFIGVTVGRVASGFLSYRIKDDSMVLLGQGITLIGVLLLLQPFFTWGAIAGLFVIGLGCAPMYPSLLHAAPTHFGAEQSQAIMGVLMACSNSGTLFMPPLLGWIVGFTGMGIYPWFLAVILVVMFFAHRTAVKKCTPAE